MSVTKTRREEEAVLSPWDDGPCGFDAGDANLSPRRGQRPGECNGPERARGLAFCRRSSKWV